MDVNLQCLLKIFWHYFGVLIPCYRSGRMRIQAFWDNWPRLGPIFFVRRSGSDARNQVSLAIVSVEGLLLDIVAKVNFLERLKYQQKVSESWGVVLYLLRRYPALLIFKNWRKKILRENLLLFHCSRIFWNFIFHLNIGFFVTFYLLLTWAIFNIFLNIFLYIYFLCLY